MAYDRRTFILFCLTAEESKLQELLTGMREEAAAIKDRMDDLEVFLAHRPDLKAEEPAAPEKPKRGKKKAAQAEFDELADTKSQVDNRFGAIATPDQAERFNADLKNNTGEVWENRETWDLETWQKALGILRRMGIGDSLPY